VQTGIAFRMGADATDVEGCAREAVQDALGKLGGTPVASGFYRVLFRPYAFGDLLTAFSSIFSADEAQKVARCWQTKKARPSPARLLR
jgi:PmbA protein